MDTTNGSDATYVRVGDRFDSVAVEAIEQLLVALGPVTPVVLDFRGTRTFAPAPLARLARGLLGSDRRVSLRGLSEYHYRLLRYAAVSTGSGAAETRWV